MTANTPHHKRLWRVLVTCLAALSLVAFAGCGGGGPEDTIKDYLDAAADGDADKACDLVTDDFVDEELGGDCEEAIEQAGDELDDEQKDKIRDAEISDVEEDGDKATAKLEIEDQEDDEVELEKVDGDWKISGSKEN